MFEKCSLKTYFDSFFLSTFGVFSTSKKNQNTIYPPCQNGHRVASKYDRQPGRFSCLTIANREPLDYSCYITIPFQTSFRRLHEDRWNLNIRGSKWPLVSTPVFITRTQKPNDFAILFRRCFGTSDGDQMFLQEIPPISPDLEKRDFRFALRDRWFEGPKSTFETSFPN